MALDPPRDFFESSLAAGLRAGDRVWFRGERIGYTVMAASMRYKVCTKPFAPKNTVIYSIIDVDRGVRGPDNMVFSFGYETPSQCVQALDDLEQEEIEVSWRRQAPLRIRKIEVA